MAIAVNSYWIYLLFTNSVTVRLVNSDDHPHYSHDDRCPSVSHGSVGPSLRASIRPLLAYRFLGVFLRHFDRSSVSQPVRVRRSVGRSVGLAALAACLGCFTS